MKKGFIILTVYILIIWFTACSDSSNTPDKSYTVIDTANFQSGKFYRNSDYAATFFTKFVNLGKLAIHIEVSIYEEELGLELLNLVNSDYQKMSSLNKDNLRDVVLYIVKDTYTGKPVATENALFCSLGSVLNGDYRTYLTKVCFDLQPLWQCVGLSHYVFDQAEVNYEDLLAYYSKSGTNVLSLFPAYFIETFSDEVTIKVAGETAFSLTKYILSNYGMQAYLQDECLMEYIDEWLKHIGSEISFGSTDADIKSIISITKWSCSDEYPLVISSDEFEFYFSKVDWLETADDAFTLVFNFFEGLDSFELYVEENAPKYYQRLSSGDMGKVYIYIINDREQTRAIKRCAYIGRPDAIWHEVIHCLTPVSEEIGSRWLCEGLTTLLEMPIHFDFMDQSMFYDYLTNDKYVENWPQDDKLQRELAISYYAAKVGLPETAQEIDLALLVELWGYVSLMNPELAVSEIPMTYLSVADELRLLNRREISNYPGNELTYPEAMVFTKYLVNKFDLDTVIAAVMDYNVYKEIIPDYETAFAEFLYNLPQEY